MSEENGGQQAGEQGQQQEFKAPATQAELDRIIGERLSREKAKYADYDDLKTKASEYDKAQEASKSELQKEREAREAAEKERDSVRQAHWRAEVALEKGLTPTQAKRLVGSTKEEFAADADELLADLGAKPGGKKPDPKKLQSGSTGSGDQLTGKERAAAALRQMRGTN